MAHTKAKGTSHLGRDSASQRLGVKKFAGESVKKGMIIIRQRGTKYHAGLNTILTGDDSIVADAVGKVVYSKKKANTFYGRSKNRVTVSVG